MKVSLPTDVAFSKVTTADHYESKYFTITMPGDWVDYFTNNPITFDSSVVSKVSCSLNSSGKTVIKVTTPTLQGFRLYEETGYIGVEIGDPTDVYENIVVLDAGHGGTDPGTSKGSTKEKDLNFQIIYTLAKKYFDSADSPVKAYWTRKTDTFVALTTRASFADTVGADLFVSLHMNSASSSSAKGMEVLYASNNKNTLGSANTKKIASEYSSYLLDTLEMTGRTSLTVDRTKLVVLYKNTVPSVLIELGFLSNSSDLKKLTDDDFQDLAAKSIYEATVQVFEKYPTGR
jgi:N-acetylmuramoyl-L-alanine amidase